MAGVKKSRGRNNPKVKSNRAACKRFKKTGSGAVKFWSKGHRHGLSNKTRKHKRQQRRARFLRAEDAKLVARQIPYL